MIEELEYRFLHLTELCGDSEEQAYETLAMEYGLSKAFIKEHLWKR